MRGTTPPQWQPTSVRPPNARVLIRYLDGEEGDTPCLAFASPQFVLKSPWRDVVLKRQLFGWDSLSMDELQTLKEANLDNPEHTTLLRWDIETESGNWEEISPDKVTHWMSPG